MNQIDRRSFLKTAMAAGIGAGAFSALAADTAGAGRKFSMCLAGGPIGVPGDPRKAIGWATQYGFESIEPQAGFLAKLSDGELQEYLGQMREKKLAWGAAGLPVQFRGEDGPFEQSMKSFPDTARALQRAGVTRMATWLSPGHNSLTYIANFRMHAKRLRESAKVLGDHGIRLGLEYVGPKTSWTRSRFPFIHTMAEMKDLIAEIGTGNVGFLIDSWHWYTARETEADLLTLKNADVLLCHLNDAPTGLAPDEQMDNRRELPSATGVIDTKTFLGAMVKIGYDGPVVCEPFSQALKGKTPDESLAMVSAAMKKAFALVQ